MRLAIVIPIYDHGKTIVSLLHKLEQYKLPCIIVDDGSHEETKQQLVLAQQQFSWVEVLTMPANQGKGAALFQGFQLALKQGFTHALQIDADNQHTTDDIPQFIQQATMQPDYLISGKPIYDASVPKSRLYGRKVTNFWVAIETLSLSIADAMCGFRVYPLQTTVDIMHKHSIGKRMAFDIDILVRLYWQSGKVIFVPTRVVYPTDGVSHFKLWRDNILISLSHTRLFFNMFLHLPQLIKTNIKAANKNQKKHWSHIQEQGGLIGLRAMLFSYQTLGKTLTCILMYPVMVYYFLVCKEARLASKRYLSYLSNMTNTKQPHSFMHFISFGKTIIDKLAVWSNKIGAHHIVFPNHALLTEKVNEGKGGVIFTAHLGNMDIARALSRLVPDVKINSLVFNQHAQQFNALLEKINPAFKMNIIQLEQINVESAIKLNALIEQGEYIVIAADRTSPTRPERSLPVQFLKQQTFLPQGPFILAGLLKCPTYYMLCMKESAGLFTVHFSEFSNNIAISKSQRKDSLQQHAQLYANYLEKVCLQYPLQWFNFFDFWAEPKQNKGGENV